MLSRISEYISFLINLCAETYHSWASIISDCETSHKHLLSLVYFFISVYSLRFLCVQDCDFTARIKLRTCMQWVPHLNDAIEVAQRYMTMRNWHDCWQS